MLGETSEKSKQHIDHQSMDCAERKKKTIRSSKTQPNKLVIRRTKNKKKIESISQKHYIKSL